MKHFILLLFLLPTYCLPAQQVSVYFASNGHSLYPEGTRKLNGLVDALDTSRYYLVELGGYTDSTNTRGYNVKLASRRIECVKSFITSKLPAKKLRFKTVNYGEEFPFILPGNPYDKSLNRKVEVCCTEITPDFKLLYTGPFGITFRVDINDKDSCAVCQSGNNLYAVLVADSILRIDMDRRCNNFEGMPCKGTEIRIPGERYRFLSGGKECTVDIFKSCRAKVLPDTSYFDPAVDEYVFKFTCLSQTCLCRYRKPCSKVLNLPAFDANRLIVRGKFSETITDDSLKVPIFCDTLDIRNIGKTSNRYFILHTSSDKLAPFVSSGMPEEYTIPFNAYKELTYNDTLLTVKVRKGKKGDDVAFYLHKYKYPVLLKQVRNKKHRAYVTTEGHELSINGQLMDQGYKLIRQKFKKRKKRLKMVIRKTN